METEAMDVQQQDGGQGGTPDRVVPQESHVHTTQPQVTRKPDVTGPVSAEIVHSGSNESLIDGVTTNDDTLLLPDHIPTISRKIEKGNVKPSLPNGSSPPVNGSTIICTPPASAPTPHLTTQQKCNGHAKCNGHKHPHRKHMPSTSMSQQSFKGDASQIQRVAGDEHVGHV